MSSQTASKPTSPAKAGLEGVVAVSSDLCRIDGQKGELIYHGYQIADLVENTTFEENCHLLWRKKLPNRRELDDLKRQLGQRVSLPGFVIDILRALPGKTVPMDALRTAVSSLASEDPDLTDVSEDANWRRAVDMQAKVGPIVGAFHRLRQGKEVVEPDPQQSVAYNFLYTANGEAPNETLVRVMDACLVLHAEHGMNASTFTSHVVASTLCDMYGIVTAAIAALKGPLHGGANQNVMELLLEVGDGKPTEQAVKDAEDHVRRMLANKEKVPGFGHRVYKTFDPRATFLSKMSKQLGEAAGETKWYEISTRLIDVVKQEKGLDPNVDFFSASAYYTMGIPLDLFTPIFAVARTAGWCGHGMEQQADNRIIRPTDEYTGPEGLKVVPIDQRD